MVTTEGQRDPNSNEAENQKSADNNSEKQGKAANGGAEEKSFQNDSNNGRSFHIDFYNRRDHYRGRIVLLGGNEKKVFDGIDIASIYEFISQHLPELTKAVASGHFFDKIVFHQESRMLKSGETLKARKPFYTCIRWNLPVIPTDDNLDLDTRTYAVEVVVIDYLKKQVVACNDEADVLLPGVARYSTTILLRGLDPGKYVLKIIVSTALGRVKESTKIEISVGM